MMISTIETTEQKTELRLLQKAYTILYENNKTLESSGINEYIKESKISLGFTKT